MSSSLIVSKKSSESETDAVEIIKIKKRTASNSEKVCSDDNVGFNSSTNDCSREFRKENMASDAKKGLRVR